MSSDLDPIETQEWLAALASVVECEGAERARFLLETLINEAQQLNLKLSPATHTPYINTLPLPVEAQMPKEDLETAERLRAIMRWNAAAMVIRAGKIAPELGGHIATYASIATIYEVGFDFFFRARNKDFPGDLLFLQGHSSPGIYARAFLEGRISEEQLIHFRQEIEVNGLSSYPHPWLMPDFWQFTTVSMGLGPLQAIYQARFLHYLENRGLIDNKGRKVWVFCGDGEMDEPESLGALSIAAREKLDNLILVVNCNLLRLDGPVRGNGKIIQELESIFNGSGWNVIKVIWSSDWDALLARDQSGLLKKRMQECVDGEYQNYVVHGVNYFREHFFGKYPELKELVSDMSDEELKKLNRGGHDPQKVYAAYDAATKHKGQPTALLIKTVKGYGMGPMGEGINAAHQQKKMSTEDLEIFCKRFQIPIPKNKIADVPFYRPAKNSPELIYLHKRRKELGGYLPARQHTTEKLIIPDLTAFHAQLVSGEERQFSTTMAFTRILAILLKDKNIKERVVPIIPDETRTFGMEGLFRQIGIYSPAGQLYEPVDKQQVMFYHEAKNGQLLEEGLNEAGAFASWLAAATSYSTNGLPMIPFYIYYSMFGFQRIGDFAWAAADMRARGFLLGATAGRTTLAGEGLQHQDGHSHIFSSVIPNCVSYDPTFAYELAVIIQNGLRRMVQEQEDVYYYITLMNENYTHPTMPKGAEEGIIKGMYLFKAGTNKTKTKLNIQLLGSGTILREVITAAEMLEKDYGVCADIWSVPSFTELRREALDVERENRLHPERKAKIPYVSQCLNNRPGPIIAATDYMRLFADQIRNFINKPYHVLGTDGFGRSDTRKKLRDFFEVDAKTIAYTAIYALVQDGQLVSSKITDAIKRYGIRIDKQNPMKT